MKTLTPIVLLFALASCGQDYNSSSFDELVYDRSLTTGTPFYEAYLIIEEKCIDCHNNNYHGEWGGYTTSADWSSRGLVTAGDFENSVIIARLNNYGGDMPQGGGNLTETELTTLRTWIEGL